MEQPQMPLINFIELTQLLTSNWTRFIDRTILMKEVLLIIRDTKLENQIIGKIKKNIELRISRCEPSSEGILVWIEFNVPKSSKSVSVGTIEMIISWSKEFKINGIIGEEIIDEQFHEDCPQQ